MSKFPPPGEFNFSLPDSWPTWKQRFERFRIASELTSKDGKVQVASLLYSMGADAETVFAQLHFDDADDSEKFDKVIAKLDDYFVPALNVFHQRTLFEQCVHLPGETVEQFVRKLHSAAEFCQFSDKDTRIRDRIVALLLDRQVATDLQKEDPKKLTLAATIQKARQAEKVAAEVASQLQPQTLHAASQAPHPFSNAPKRQERSKQSTSDSESCPYCGQTPSHIADRHACPASGRKCSQCSRLGHFASVCKSTRAARAVEIPAQSAPQRAPQQPQQQTQPTPTMDHPPPEQTFPFLGAAQSQDQVTGEDSSNSAWSIVLPMCGTSLTFKIDTGADVCCITEYTYNKLPERPSLVKTPTPLQGPSGADLSAVGHFLAHSMYKGEAFSFTVCVIRGTSTSNLLSRQESLRLGLIKRLQQIENQPEPTLGCMVGPPVDIELTDDSKPYHCGVARRVALPLYDRVKEELQRMEQLGVIVPETEPTDWCSPMVPVLKPNGSVRICVDLKKLNTNVKREYFPLPTVEDTLAKLAGSTVFSTLDANSGFWQIPLTEKASKLTTFITPFGRFRFLRMPFGITSAPEIFHRRVQSLLDGVTGTQSFIDDVLVHAPTTSVHDTALQTTKSILKKNGITLNESKCKYRQTSVKYLGHIVSGEGIKPDPDKVQAISDLPEPTNVQELRRALGMFTYLGRFLPDLSTVSAPLRSLLRSEAVWSWDATQSAAFAKLQHLAATAPCLAHYDAQLPTIVSADASSYGIGGVLLQQHHNSEWHPVAYASRSLTTTEQGYAQIEKECLASVWTCERFDQYLYGAKPFILHTDHKPLVPLINTRDLDKVPLRCQRMLLRFLRYDVKAEHVPGKNMVVPDTLSRAPSPLVAASTEIAEDIQVALAAVTDALASPHLQQRIAEATASDPILSAVARYTVQEWPQTVPSPLLPYHQERGHLSLVNGILSHGLRLVIPATLQPEILVKLHEGHQGMTKTKARAKDSVWWPGITTEIDQYVANCNICIKQRFQAPEPLQATEFPTRPWERLASDLCESNGMQYLITVDYYSRFIDVHRLHSTTSQAIIKHLKSLFAVHGFPDVIVSDNGPQFSSREFEQFTARCNIRHRTSSPHHPQSNGEAERAVQTAKRLIASSGDLDEALLAYRSTPLANGYSPAELLFGRRIRSSVPCASELLKPAMVDNEKLQRFEQKHKQQQQRHFDNRHRARQLPPLAVGSKVFIADLAKEGTVVSQVSNRSYTIATTSGVIRRNRSSLKYLPPSIPPPPAHAPSQPAPPQNHQPTYNLRNRGNLQQPTRLISEKD